MSEEELINGFRKAVLNYDDTAKRLARAFACRCEVINVEDW